MTIANAWRFLFTQTPSRQFLASRFYWLSIWSASGRVHIDRLRLHLLVLTFFVYRKSPRLASHLSTSATDLASAGSPPPSFPSSVDAGGMTTRRTPRRGRDRWRIIGDISAILQTAAHDVILTRRHYPLPRDELRLRRTLSIWITMDHVASRHVTSRFHMSSCRASASRSSQSAYSIRRCRRAGRASCP